LKVHKILKKTSYKLLEGMFMGDVNAEGGFWGGGCSWIIWIIVIIILFCCFCGGGFI
jgi:hypothetical protein